LLLRQTGLSPTARLPVYRPHNAFSYSRFIGVSRCPIYPTWRLRVFPGRFSSSIGAIGIDFGSRGIKMVQVRDKAGALQVIGAARIDVSLARVRQPTTPGQVNGIAPVDGLTAGDDDAAGLAPQIRAAFAGGNFSGARCVISLAREDVCLQSIRLPKMSDEELRQTATWEASQRFGFDRTAMEVDFIRTGAMAAAGAGENREEVILIAASHAAIHARVEPVLAAGLRPIAVDTGFSALVRTFSRHARRESDRSHVRAVVEVGESGSIVLFLRGDQIAFCKPIAIGGRDFNQAVAEHLQIDAQQAAELRAARIAGGSPAAGSPAPRAGNSAGSESRMTETDPSTDRAVYEAVRPLMGDLVKEVTLCLRYYGVTFRGHPPDHIILTGGDGLEPRLGEVMAQACKTPVVFDDAGAQASDAGAGGILAGLIPQIRNSLNRTPGPAAAWAVAVGLSARGIKSEASRDRSIPAASDHIPAASSSSAPTPASVDSSARRSAAA
jgi:type IV pilus assembly protein PilM